MMQIFILTFVILGLSIIGLSIGVILSNRRIQGSCGGINAIPGMDKSECSCSNPCEKRLAREAAAEAESGTIQKPM